MAKASDNPFPSLLLVEQGSAPAGPVAGTQRLFLDDADNHLKRVDSTDAVVDLEGKLTDQGAITYLDATVAAAPGTPGAGKLRIYAKTGKVLAAKDDAGNETVLGDTATLNLVVDGGGAAIATGIKLDVVVDFACTIVGYTLLADQSGSIVIDLWKDTYANFPPTDADSITAAAPPTLSAAAKAQDTTLTGWTKSVAAGDVIRANVDSAATVQRVTLALRLKRA